MIIQPKYLFSKKASFSKMLVAFDEAKTFAEIILSVDRIFNNRHRLSKEQRAFAKEHIRAGVDDKLEHAIEQELIINKYLKNGRRK